MITTTRKTIDNSINKELDLIIELNNGSRKNIQYNTLEKAKIDADILFVDDWIIPIKNITCMRSILPLEKQIKSVLDGL